MAIKDMQKPITNGAAAGRAEAANKVSMQQQMGRMTAQQAMQGGPQQAQQAGAMAAEAQGQVAVQAAEAQANDQLRQAANEMQSSQLEQQKRNIVAEENLTKKTIKQEEELSAMGREFKADLFDSRRDFAEEQGEARFTDHTQNLALAQELQLSEIELQDYGREVMQAAEMDVAVMNHAYETLVAEETRLSQQVDSAANRASLARIQEYKEALAEERQKSQAKANKFKKQLGAATFVVAAGVTIATSGSSAPVTGPLMVAGAQQASS